MKLTPTKITAAYRAALELSNIVLPYKEGRAVLNLKKRLAEENDIVADVEKTLVAEYGGKTSGNGRCDFPDEESAQRCQEALEDVRKQEDEIKLPTVDLSKYTNLIRISPAAIEALEGIVIFDPPEKEDTDG